jgi:hypothetical protein
LDIPSEASAAPLDSAEETTSMHTASRQARAGFAFRVKKMSPTRAQPTV